MIQICHLDRANLRSATPTLTGAAVTFGASVSHPTMAAVTGNPEQSVCDLARSNFWSDERAVYPPIGRLIPKLLGRALMTLVANWRRLQPSSCGL
jgi:hypothetical protein